jgi:Ca-activated chloride channel family protein
MDLGINLRFDHQLLAVEAEHHVHCMLELTAPPAPTTASRKPLHLALVIDRSGSMNGRKLATAIECAVYLARRLSPTDHLGVVTYDDDVRLEWPMSPVGPSTTQLEQVLRSITPGGMTNLSGGWLKGVEQLRSIPGGSGPKKVLLLSDGLANVGISDAASLIQMAHGAEEEGVGTTTIGFGEGFDEDLMTGMADAGSGTAHFAATPEEAPAIFAKEFEGLASIVAQNLSVELRPSDEVKVLGVLNDYPQVPVLGGIQLQLGDAYGEERRRIVFELFVPRLAELGVATVAQAVVRYVSMGAQIVAHELTVPVTVNLVAADEAAASGADHEVTEEVVILKAARAQTEARDRATAGDIDGARGLLRDAAKQLRASAPASARPDELDRQADEMEEHLGLLEAGSFDPMTSKKMRYQSRERQKRRGERGPS